MRAAVVGAGVYGCTVAAGLARAGHRVDLYERHQGLLLGATRGNQARLHAGFHYPRSPETAAAAQADAERFAARFPRAVDWGHRHHYAVARSGSLTSAQAYLDFCDGLGGHVVTDPPLLHGTSVCVLVGEAFVNVGWLRAQLRGELRAEGVTVHLGAEVAPDTLDHDLVVVAAYGRGWPAPLRWEVCEVALVEAGPHYVGRSFVVVDGPFVSLDPVADQPRLHALYDVASSVHASNTGMAPEVPEHLAPLLDRGQVPTAHTRVDAMWATARRFLGHLGMVRYHGSLFTVRAVLPDVDATDTRPTLFHRDGRVVHVLAGKIDGAVAAAERVVAMAGDLEPACSSAS
jgi:hypothetical protein